MDSINYSLTGTVFDIQRFSLHDGPGIRTIVFLKGCPLSCKWCSNPESQNINSVLLYSEKDCIGCNKCISVCKLGAISRENPNFIDRDKCTGCGECVNTCVTGALVLKGKPMTIAQLINELKKDATMFRRSGGGVTLSGGEPLVQHEFAAELLKACHAQGWNTAMETTGLGSELAIKSVIPHVDTVLLDIKSTNSNAHKEFTGVTNEIILKNAQDISKLSNTIIRVPIIPGFNYSVEEVESIAEFAKTMRGVRKIHLLPYHNFGQNKYGLMGKNYQLDEVKPLKAELLDECKKVVEKHGFECEIGG